MSLQLSTLCRDLCALSVATRCIGTTGGREWEKRVQAHLALRSVPVEALPGGARVFGMASLSGLQHQVDLTLGASDALVIVECKAYRRGLPKNELLKFKAVTDDYYMSIGADLPNRPIVRLFGGPSDARHEVRRYAAYHGIVLIERSRWPVPFLISQNGWWTPTAGLPFDVAASLARLCRPMQQTLSRQPDGSYRISAFPSRIAVDAMLALHDRWSEWLWREVDAIPGWFEEMITHRFGHAVWVA